MERINILFGHIVVKDGNKKTTLPGCVFKEGDTHYKKKEIVEVLSFKIVGQTAITNGYTEASKSDEVRNNITGAYE